MAWLSGYNKRIKIPIDHSKVDADLSDFPVTVFFTSTQGEEIFNEFTLDSQYMKCAFTKADGVTQLYAEKEMFDVAGKKAIYHVKVPSVSSSADTDIYYYYNKNASDNTTYVGAIGSTAGEHVWDSNFKAVYHMVDNTTSTILDSTSNSNDGTKKAANEPIEAAGKVGKGQYFDGTDDYIQVPTTTDFDFRSYTQNWTLSALICPAKLTGGSVLGIGTADFQALSLGIIDGKLITDGSTIGTGWDLWLTQALATMSLDTWYWINVANVGGVVTQYINMIAAGTDTITANLLLNNYTLKIGAQYSFNGSWYFKGIVGEVRISSVARSAAWDKATYNALWDTLLTYGSEEMAGNAIMFSMNF